MISQNFLSNSGYVCLLLLGPRSYENPMLVMVDEATGERYARAVGHKGLGQGGEQDWLIKDMSEELKTWGHAGGQTGHIILKSDGESSIVTI